MTDTLDKYLASFTDTKFSDTGIMNIALRFNVPMQLVLERIDFLKGITVAVPIPKRKVKPKPKKTWIEYDQSFIASAEKDGLRFLNQMVLREKKKITEIAYCDKTANGLTKCIIDFVLLSGGMAERINSMGRVIDKRLYVKDDFGRTKIIGLPKWIKSNGTLGTADISATINGLSVKIEVKIGKDPMSQHQVNYKADVERAGGIYLIASNFQSFYDWYNSKFCEI